MEPPQGALRLREAVAQVAASLEAPLSRAALIERALALCPSRATQVGARILSLVRAQTTLVPLPDGRLAPLTWVLRGVRFRYAPTPRETESGLLPLFPCFVPFLLESRAVEGLPPRRPTPTLLQEGTGRAIDAEPFDLHGALLQDQALPGSGVQFQALMLRDWFAAHRVAPGDSLLLTVDDPARGVFRVAHEPAARADQAAMEQQDALLEAELVRLLARSRSNQVFLEDIVPAALAGLGEAVRAYPGSHWREVVRRSPRLRLVDDYALARATFLRPIDRLTGYAASPAAQQDLEARMDTLQADARRALAKLGIDSAAPPRSAHPSEQAAALHASAGQIAAFLQCNPDKDCHRCLAVPSVYLARQEGVSLAEADAAMLSRFLLSFYPRRVLWHRKTFTRRMLSVLRRFYLSLDPAVHPLAPSLPLALSRLHALADRKIALLSEIDQDGPQSAHLFPEADKEGEEMASLSYPPEADAPKDAP